MATGGIFQLITNDGKQDRMLMASALLKTRIDNARSARMVSHPSDPTPTLYDIERTHILFTNAHFKPFAAIGYEYNKVTTSAGSGALGGNVTFSIPQFGDFFNDMVVHATLTQPLLSTRDASNNVVPVSDQNLMRWCSYPGERLLKSVKFEVNGNPLDEYTRHATNFHREFSVQPNKEQAWDRCVGQQSCESGHLDQPNWVGSGVSASDVQHQMKVQSSSGNQTPTGQKTENLDLFIPLLFWCNKDPRLAVPSVAIPYGQRFITIELATSDELVGEVPRGAYLDSWTSTSYAAGGALAKATLSKIELYINNIFVNPEVHNIFIKRIGFTLIRVHRQQIKGGVTREVSTESVLLQQLKWPIEALFVGLRVEQYNNPSSADMGKEHLDKWHKFSVVAPTTRTQQGWKSQRASVTTGVRPASVLGAGITSFELTAPATDAPAFLTAVGVPQFLKPGDALTITDSASTVATVHVVSVDAAGLVFTLRESGNEVLDLGLVHNDNYQTTQPSLSIVRTTCVSAEVSATVDVLLPTLSSLTIKAHGIPIYNNFPAAFYNAYLPYNYGGHNIRAPSDPGALLITFCLYPGTYQPSGHINVSRAREFYIDFTTTGKIPVGQTGQLVVVASAINFLLISDGSAVLRYST